GARAGPSRLRHPPPLPRSSPLPPPYEGGFPPPVSRVRGYLTARFGVTVDIPSLGLVRRIRRGRRIVLHDVVARRSRNPIFIRTVAHHGRVSAKVVVRRRRGRGPLERGGFPGIVRRLGSLEDAPEEVDYEHQLCSDGDDGAVSDELVQRDQVLEIRDLGKLR